MRESEWSQLRAQYDANSQAAEFDCHLALQSWREGNQSAAMQQAAALWTVGRSQPSGCDALFDRWRASGGLTEDVAWARIREALLYREDALARYLVRYMPSQNALAELFVDTAIKPAILSQSERYRPGPGKPSDKLADIATVSLRRLSRDDPAKALSLWPYYRDLPFTQEDRLAITRDIGIRMARRHAPEALPFMAANDPKMLDDQITEWRVRLALRTGQWQIAQNLTSNQPYALRHKPAQVEPAVFARVSNAAGTQRAREFFARGQIVDARREWYHVGKVFSREELIAQAMMAKDMEWYFPAIRGISLAQHWDDLDIRFPMAYQEPIRAQAAARQLNSTWVYAITRQESAFMADARSHAGAMGLMQLMPATAKETARRYDITLNNPNDVLIPERNIALGTAYLSQLNGMFKGNRVLASAAYNAGPGRVRQWTREMPTLPADIWIETIPFDETRTYVQSVLSYAVIYGQKMGIRQPVIEQNERYLEAY